MTDVTTTSRTWRYGASALLTWANCITLARIAGVPLLILAMVQNRVAWSTFLLAFILAGSDGLDGIIARRHGATRSGAFLDPLADKFLVLGALFTLVHQDVFSWVPVAIICARELGISAYRSYWGRRGLAVPARRSAKAKTFVQELAVGLVLAPLTAGHPGIGITVLWVAVAMTVVSGLQYVLDGRAAATSMAETRTA
ncbi:MAG TPA: CDP-alcohol phosphatidyltransferase family protein [Acidimicrobiales bacterium]|jgi:CDP-diacylglycerol--glycerol-3-phosphate 3-phosphatidyltransferase|nr:CDP-alcohol phosphatidyltransferase family protein [Acidimicrobiales bacterium]